MRRPAIHKCLTNFSIKQMIWAVLLRYRMHSTSIQLQCVFSVFAQLLMLCKSESLTGPWSRWIRRDLVKDSYSKNVFPLCTYVSSGLNLDFGMKYITNPQKSAQGTLDHWWWWSIYTNHSRAAWAYSDLYGCINCCLECSRKWSTAAAARHGYGYWVWNKILNAQSCSSVGCYCMALSSYTSKCCCWTCETFRNHLFFQTTFYKCSTTAMYQCFCPHI